MVERSLVLKGVVAAVVLAGVAVGAVFYVTSGDFQYAAPQVESIESEFGTATESTTEVRTRVVVQNPNERSLPGAAEVGYTVYLNEVEVAHGRRAGVGLAPGRNEIRVDGSFDNSQVPAWWVRHVNSGERSELVVSPEVSVTGLPLRQRLENRTTTVETDLLGPLASGETTTVVLADREVLVVSNRTASWGRADAQETPVEFSVDLENVHDRPVELDGTEYRVEMNGVVVGEGTTDGGIRLAPGESETFTTRAVLDSQRMQDWWVTHVRERERTDLTVEVYGVVTDDGERKRVPLNVFDSRLRFTTRLLGDGSTVVEPLPSNGTDVSVGTPEVVSTEAAWGEVGEDRTEIRTRVTVDNPTDEAYADLLELLVDQRTTINGVVVAENATRVETIPSGRGTFTLAAQKRHDTVPQWWARHVNRGERSRVHTNVTATADVGVTTLPVDLPDRETTLETDVVGYLESEEDSHVTHDGRRVLTVTRTQAEWGTATPERGPIRMRVTVRNEQFTTVTIRDINYTVALNDVRLADEADLGRTFEIPPASTRTLEFTVVLDNSKMEAWWPTHVRNGEVSRLGTEAYATVEAGGRSERTALDFLGNDATIETDVLGEDTEDSSSEG